MDDKGNLLGIQEVWERIIADLPVTINEDANWNNTTPYTKEKYIDSYRSKNLYYLVCPVGSEFNTETYVEGKPLPKYVELLPEGFESMNNGYYTTHNPDYFWGKPQ